MPGLHELLKEGRETLSLAGIDDADLDAWLLLEYVTKIDKAHYYMEPSRVVGKESSEVYRRLVGMRADHIPLQHLTHQAFFMGYEFYVDEHVLIPRQDTETLVEIALSHLDKKDSPVNILDMCTGSGCILISLLKEIPTARGRGVDLSEEALGVAGKNAERLAVSDRAEWLKSNLFDHSYFYDIADKRSSGYDMIISNPPYIARKEIDGLMEEVRLHDPLMALDGGEDGLDFYRNITSRAIHYLRQGGMLIFEIGYDQGKAVSDLLKDQGYRDVEVFKDLSGLDRVVLGRL